MTLNSVQYLLFLPVAVALYYITPGRLRWFILLIASYFFYACWNIELVFWLALITLVSYGAAFLIDKKDDPSARKLLLEASCVIILAVLFAFKYVVFGQQLRKRR